MHRTTLALALFILGLPGAVSAQDASTTRPPVTLAHRVEAPPAIDGRGDDRVWAALPAVRDFVQSEPREGAAPSQATEFKVAFDDDNLYVLVRALDTHPDSILHALSRRDSRGPSDQITIVIDSYRDRRTGYEFAVNPDGVKRDNSIYNDGQRDGSWDGVWEVATSVDAGGWTAEFRIPLSQLRYPSSPESSFGFGIYRDIERHTEKASWPAISRSRQGFVSQMGTLEGLGRLGGSRGAEVTPYVVAKSETEPRANGSFRRAEGFALGSDVKLKLSPNFTVDATVNPDFGQVEADPGVLNLDAFETFVGEKRPFFLEGTALYRFQTNCSIVNCSSESLIYSRRIGRSPELRSKYGDATTATATPIAAAAKITGTTTHGLSFGGLSAVTRRVEGLQNRTVEPLTNRAAFIVDQNLDGGNAGVRFTATGVNRSLDEWTASFMHESAYTGALSGRVRFGPGKNYGIEGWAAGSRVAGSREALAATQKNAVHYFQQPDAGLTLDPTLTSMSGSGFQVTFGKGGGGITRFQTSFIRQSPGFEVNDLGYQRRADWIEWATWGALQFNTPTSVYRSFQWNGNVWRDWNSSGTPTNLALNTNAHLFLLNNWSLHAGGTVDRVGETYCNVCTRGGPLLRNSRSYGPWLNIDGDSRRKLVPHVGMNLSFQDEGRTLSVSSAPAVDLRFSTRLDGRIGMTMGFNHANTQWISNVVSGGTTHYVFARMEQQQTSLTLRLNYTATPNLTVQFYGEPFVSRGEYSEFRELSATPRAARYADRFVAYANSASLDQGFHFRQLKTNTVVRWEYLPGSTLFLAWAHGRSANGGPTNLSWGDELRDIFDQHADNTFLIKVAHWLSW